LERRVDFVEEESTVLRRFSALMAVLAAVAMSFAGTAGIAAQDATPPAMTFADTMGLPELQINVTDTAFEGVPTETAAGRYVVTLNISASDGGGAGFLQLPEGMTFDDFMAIMGGPPPSPEAGMANMGTPAIEGSPPVGGGPEGAPPEWIYTTKIAGGTGGGPGQTLQVIVDLTPGNWIVWGDDPEAAQPPVPLTVTGETPATPGPEPTAAATATLFEYGFKVDGTLATGPQTLKVTNVGAQPHFLILLKSPVEVTKEQVGEIVALDMTGGTPAPDAGLPNPEEFVDAAYVATLSTGSTAWIPVNLEPGYYVLLCFFPDIASGMPHAAEGMYDVIEVTG
jgi:hypothetical protein